MSTKTDQLKELLLKSNQEGVDKQALKIEAKEFLKTVDSNDLIAAEQSLIDEGMNPSELKHLCSAHLELIGETGSILTDLPNGHPIKTLMSEHQVIVKYLNNLEEINDEIQKAPEQEGISKSLLDQLEEAASNLLEAEKHHQREEDVLFPEVIKRGMSGPPRIMELEHNDLRSTKKALYVLARSNIDDVEKFKERLDQLTSHLIQVLRDHIFKEDNILYPSSLDLIIDQRVWSDIKNKCDGIGYCCFTPKTL